MAVELSKREKKEVQQTSAEQLIDAKNAYSPDVDIYDITDALVFIMDVPGVSKGDVNIEIDENNVLSIRAKTSYDQPDGLVMQEFCAGNYYRAFSLSDEFNKDGVTAKLENGVLELTVPRREEVKPRKIQINA